MATRWEVEEAVMQSSLEPTGRHIVLTLVSLTNASTAEIPPRHTPSFTDLERLTGYSRSTLIEWMKLLTESHWVSRTSEEGTTRQGMALAVGGSSAARPKRARDAKKVDAAYRQAVQVPPSAIPPGGTDRTAQRYAAIPPGGTPTEPHLLIENSPTESSNPTTNLDRAPSADTGPAQPVLAGLAVATEPQPSRNRLSRRVTKKAEPLPDDWSVSDEMIEWAKRETPNVGRFAADKFIDYFSGAPGNKGLKKDWDATWRNWMRRDQEGFEERNGYRGETSPHNAGNSPVRRGNNPSRWDDLDRNPIRSPADQRVADGQALYNKYRARELGAQT